MSCKLQLTDGSKWGSNRMYVFVWLPVSSLKAAVRLDCRFLSPPSSAAVWSRPPSRRGAVHLWNLTRWIFRWSCDAAILDGFCDITKIQQLCKVITVCVREIFWFWWAGLEQIARAYFLSHSSAGRLLWLWFIFIGLFIRVRLCFFLYFVFVPTYFHNVTVDRPPPPEIICPQNHKSDM